MVIQNSDIKFFYTKKSSTTAGSTDAERAVRSLGGRVTSNEITSDTLGNVFDEVSGTEAGQSGGFTDYRCIAVKNNASGNTGHLNDPKIYISTPNSHTGATLNIQVDTAVSATNPTLAEANDNTTTAPSGISFPSSPPVDEAAALAFEELEEGFHKGIWLRRNTDQGVAQGEVTDTLRVIGNAN